jgi:uncharacterized protein YcgI (DUF1989 family)
MLTSSAPGPVLRDGMLPAGGRTAFAVDRGQTVRVVDVDGQQVADFRSEDTNRWRYGVADTPNCRSNFEAALRPFGIPLKEVPYSFNIFMNVPIGDGKIGIAEPLSQAGDHVDLRAETDLLVAFSNCPPERNPCNAYTPTRLRVVVFGVPPA